MTWQLMWHNVRTATLNITLQKKKKKEDRCRHVLTNNFHRIVHEKKEVWRVIPCVFLLSHLQLLFFFFLQILKAGLNNGDGLSKHIGQSLGEKT